MALSRAMEEEERAEQDCSAGMQLRDASMTFGDIKRTTFLACGVAIMEFCLGCGNDLPLSTN